MEVLTALARHWEILAALASLGASIFVLWLSSRFMPRDGCAVIRAACEDVHKDLRVEAGKLEKRLDTEAAGLARVEELLRHLPTAESLHKLELSLTRVSGELKSLETQARGQGEVLQIVRKQTERINAYLMEHGHGVK